MQIHLSSQFFDLLLDLICICATVFFRYSRSVESERKSRLRGSLDKQER